MLCLLSSLWLGVQRTVVVQNSLQTVPPRRYSENLNVSVLCPLPPTFGLSRVYNSITLTDKTPKTGKISTKMCRSIHHTGLPIILDHLKISATGSVAVTQYWDFFYYDRYIYKKTSIYNRKIVLQSTTRIGKKSQHSLRIFRPSNPFPRVKTPAAYVRVRCYTPARFSNFVKDFLAGPYH